MRNVWHRYDGDYGWLMVEEFAFPRYSMFFEEAVADEYFC